MTEGMGMSGPARRFSLRIDPWWRPALFLIGLAGDRAWAELDSESLVVRFGFFRYRFARRSIAAAAPATVNWLWGIGIHTDLVRRLIINGSLAGMVELRFAPPGRIRLFSVIPVRFTHLWLSLDDPAAFLAALGVPTDVADRPRS